MKKIAWISLLLIGLLVFTACGPTSFQEADPFDYVTLGTYKGLSYKESAVQISDYERTVALNNKLAEKGYCEEHYDPLTKGTVQIGDTVNIDYKGTKDGVAFEGGTASGQSLTIGSAQFIEGFEEGLVGVAIGDTVKLNLTFPISYQNADLAGEAVVFEVRVNNVNVRRKYAPLTDAIAKELDSTVDTKEELLQAIDKELQGSLETSAANNKIDTLWNEVIEGCTFTDEVPDSLQKIYADLFEKNMQQSASQAGYEDIEAAIAGGAISREEYEAQRDAYAESQAKVLLVAYAIAKTEGYEVSDADLQSKALEYARQYGYQTATAYINAVGEEYIRNQIVLDYAMDLILEKAVIK